MVIKGRRPRMTISMKVNQSRGQAGLCRTDLPKLPSDLGWAPAACWRRQRTTPAGVKSLSTHPNAAEPKKEKKGRGGRERKRKES